MIYICHREHGVPHFHVLISEILPIAGAEVAGPLPADLQNYVVFTVGIASSAKDAQAGRPPPTRYETRALHRARRLMRGDLSKPSGISNATASRVSPKKSIEGTGNRR